MTKPLVPEICGRLKLNGVDFWSSVVEVGLWLVEAYVVFTNSDCFNAQGSIIYHEAVLRFKDKSLSLICKGTHTQ